MGPKKTPTKAKAKAKTLTKKSAPNNAGKKIQVKKVASKAGKKTGAKVPPPVVAHVGTHYVLMHRPHPRPLIGQDAHQVQERPRQICLQGRQEGGSQDLLQRCREGTPPPLANSTVVAAIKHSRVSSRATSTCLIRELANRLPTMTSTAPPLLSGPPTRSPLPTTTITTTTTTTTRPPPDPALRVLLCTAISPMRSTLSLPWPPALTYHHSPSPSPSAQPQGSRPGSTGSRSSGSKVCSYLQRPKIALVLTLIRFLLVRTQGGHHHRGGDCCLQEPPQEQRGTRATAELRQGMGHLR